VKINRLIVMILADVILILAQIAFFSASATNDTLRANGTLGLSILAMGVITWAAITASGFRWLRIVNGFLLAIFVAAWVVLITLFFMHAD
jgi:hypothetical protein